MPVDLDTDFRYLEGGVFELLVPVESGLLVVRAAGDGSFRLRSRNGAFGCSAQLDCELEPADAN
jgi:hypothetical protein